MQTLQHTMKGLQEEVRAQLHAAMDLRANAPNSKDPAEPQGAEGAEGAETLSTQSEMPVVSARGESDAESDGKKFGSVMGGEWDLLSGPPSPSPSSSWEEC